MAGVGLPTQVPAAIAFFFTAIMPSTLFMVLMAGVGTLTQVPAAIAVFSFMVLMAGVGTPMQVPAAIAIFVPTQLPIDCILLMITGV